MALNEYAGTAQQAFELMAPVVGRSSEDEWANYVFPLRQAIKRNEPLSELDWAAVLDRGRLRQRPGRLGFGRRADEFWIVELRSLQDKISNYHRYTVLRDNAAYPPRPDHLRLAIPPGCLISKDTKHPYPYER